MDRIQLNYQEMRAVASDVQGQANQARQVIASLNSSVSRLLPTWRGASQEAFQNAYDLCHKELDYVPEMLDQIAQALRQTADMIQQAEQQAAADTPATITADNN